MAPAQRDLGATLDPEGTTFAIFSRHATRAWLLLFADPAADAPSLTIELDPARNRVDDVWRMRVPGTRAGWGYLWRLDGPYDPKSGQRFNRNKVLLDPYARELIGLERMDRLRARGFDPASPLLDLSRSTDDNVDGMPRCLIVGGELLDWANDRRPEIPWAETVIYETHVRGLTIHPSSHVAHPGTYLGVIEKIPYLRSLGITAVELLPVQEFDDTELPRRNPITGEPLRNYWGYDPIALFSPKRSYSSDQNPGGPIHEFRQMVKALHEAGLELIIDIVFNHTAEGGELGPTFGFRGLDNSIYYHLSDNRRYYEDFTGCHNTVNCNDLIVQDYIIDCLHYWVEEMRVDGLRFDLAAVFARDERGVLDTASTPILKRISADPILSRVKLIAEPWDAAGAQLTGAFPARWAEWNGKYRDGVRRFWRGDSGTAAVFATRICGSADLCQNAEGSTTKSVNYITSHDGFTLNDLVAYAHKHNEANGENNQDGSDQQFAINFGREGESNEPSIAAMRLRQVKSLIATLFLSRGVPMLLGGDELRRTQRGNNNAYCQDNEISWYDWRLVETNAEVLRFVRSMISLRKAHPVLRREEFYRSDDVLWFGASDRPFSWSDELRAFGLQIRSAERNEASLLCIMFNSAEDDVPLRVPTPPGARWHIAIDTAEPAPRDLVQIEHEPVAPHSPLVTVRAKTVVVLVAALSSVDDPGTLFMHRPNDYPRLP